MKINQELAKQIHEMMDTGIDATRELMNYLACEDLEMFHQLSADLLMLLHSIESVSEKFLEVEGANLQKASRSVIASLKRIINYSFDNKDKARTKIEFELLPLFLEMTNRFYFYTQVYPDKDKINDLCERSDQYPYVHNIYMEEAEKRGSYKYDISIVVIAYNKLKYTNSCVMSLLKTMPKDLRCELIYVNHGSTDGTKAFFEASRPTKQIDIEENGGGMNCYLNIIEGKYCCQISNDIIVGENAIYNMYDFMERHEDVAWVVPTTPNVSNYQQPSPKEFNYETSEDFYLESKKNNQINDERCEQRVRLCNPIDMKRTSYLNDAKSRIQQMLMTDVFKFPDDREAVKCRRKGYKMYLMKNAYCHHFGSVTIKDEMMKINEVSFYAEGRQEFCDIYGYDPWGRGFCYDNGLMDLLPLDKRTDIKVVGIFSGLGSNPLKIKERYKEEQHITDVEIINFTNSEIFANELKSLSDKVITITNGDDFLEYCPEERYDYILYEQSFNFNERDIVKYMNRLKPNGYLAVAVPKRGGIRTQDYIASVDANDGIHEWFIYKRD